jgi:hypothetical protein
MNAVTVDGPTRDKLLSAEGEIEIRDEAGAVIGRFTRLTRVGEYLIEGELPSDAELDCRSREGNRYTASEVEERLRKLKEAVQ